MSADRNTPSWCYRGGAFQTGNGPGEWFKKTSGNYAGQWNKKELIPYGLASSEYRQEYYLCPKCDGELEPLQQEYRFACPNCRLTFSWGFGSLYGFGKDSEKAEYIE